MPTYTFHFRKVDHISPSGKADLHVHVYYNQGKSRKLIGRYRIPTLEPVFSSERELTGTEERALREWLSQEEQVNKLQNCLRDTLFDMHKVASHSGPFANIAVEGGEAYVVTKVPVARRVK